MDPKERRAGGREGEKRERERGREGGGEKEGRERGREGKDEDIREGSSQLTGPLTSKKLAVI